MSRWNPCKRKLFIKRLRELGFEGIYSGAKHQFMIYEEIIERNIIADEWNSLS